MNVFCVGAPAFARDREMRAPLMWAAASQSPKTVQHLLNYKADASDCDVDGYTPLHLAAQSGNQIASIYTSECLL